jgi:hypothetical protein
MSEPIGNFEQLPVAWFFEDDNLKWVTLYKDVMPDNAIPLYAHPMLELTDEEIKSCCLKVGVIIHTDNVPSWIKELADELIKASKK